MFGQDLVIVLIVVLIAVLFIRGPKMLPRLGEAFGRGVKEARTEVAKGLGPETDDAGDPPASA